MEDKGKAKQKATFLALIEQHIYNWVNSRVAHVQDEIVDWQKTEGTLLFEMKSGFNLVIVRLGNHCVLSQDASTAERIRGKAKKEDRLVKVLVPDARHPYKIIVDWAEPDISSFRIDGQYDLRTEWVEGKGENKGYHERDNVILPVWKVLDEGWYQKAILSGSHTSLKKSVID